MANPPPGFSAPAVAITELPAVSAPSAGTRGPQPLALRGRALLGSRRRPPRAHPGAGARADSCNERAPRCPPPLSPPPFASPPSSWLRSPPRLVLGAAPAAPRLCLCWSSCPVLGGPGAVSAVGAPEKPLLLLPLPP